MGDSSQEFNYPHDDTDDEYTRTLETPRIKLKLRLNPSGDASATAVTESDERRKKKHKKKKSHKKRKRQRNQESDDDPTHLLRRESEQVDIDGDDDFSNDEYVHEHAVPTHVPVGGKRPFALIHAEEDEDDEYDTMSIDQPIKQEDGPQFDDYHYAERTVHPMEPTPPKQPSLPPPPPPPSRPRTASTSTEHKPKKRGRPAKNKTPVKQEPRAPEPVKKDLKTICGKLLENLEKRDAYGFFLQPVDPSIVTDYLTVIKHPMDFLTMRKKLNAGQYADMEDFRQDFLLITTNAKTYNARDTIYYRSADRLEQYGLKSIDRAGKSVVYDSPQPDELYSDEHSNRNWSIASSTRRTSSISTAAGIKREPYVKVEEEVDILGLDNGSSIYPGRKSSRHDFEMRDDSSRAGTPVRALGSTKKKKKKVTEAGVVYGSDGSLAGVGGVGDLQTLIPSERHFADVPDITMVNTHALPSAFYTARSSYEEWSNNKHPVHPAHFADYGAFTALGNEPPGAFYTAQDACYIYPLYGDDRGEAYMRSLWEFAEGLDLDEAIYQKSKHLTRGAWDVLQEALKDVSNAKDVDTEFGTIHVAEFEKAYENATCNST
ncbi:hypothetical protein BJV82DRAFT_607074 [Fennellomyces sp. T-0311]|nr:hypothetical protein BJV82DRAFT_607074 [Fennellomyces sp. T-0311]